MIEGAQLKAYPGAPPGSTDTHKKHVGTDLLAFISGGDGLQAAAGAEAVSARHPLRRRRCFADEQP